MRPSLLKILAAGMLLIAASPAALAQTGCCLQVTYGPAQPADHTFTCVPGTVPEPNFMMHVRICNPCDQIITLNGVTLVAHGTGNDPSGIDQVMVAADTDCDGKADSPVLWQGSYSADDGLLRLCDTTGQNLVRILPGECVCLVIYYRMKCPAPPGDYCFKLTELLSNCEPVSICQTSEMPLQSACKTVPADCCVDLSRGPQHPANHNWTYDPANPDAGNLMMHARICLPENCPGTEVFGVQLQASGTGNDATDINWIRISLDFDCDGKPDGPSYVHNGGFPADNGVLDICTSQIGFGLPPGQCACILIEYNLKKDAPCEATYQFTLNGVFDYNCNFIASCSDALRSAVKRVLCEDCCLQISHGPKHPADHDFVCSPGDLNLNYMMQARICNPCPEPMSIFGLKLVAFGTGNDVTAIGAVLIQVDKDCDGVADGPGISATYNADNGTLEPCAAAGPLAVLQPGECVCLNIYYRMNCPTPPGSYWFEIQEIKGPNCLPLCVETLPLKSAVKYVTECCLEVSKGPNFPSDHTYQCIPGTANHPNFMAEWRICNPCPTVQCVRGLRLNAGGTGNDATGIASITITIDLDCDGKPEIQRTVPGGYPVDDGIRELCAQAAPAFCLEPGQCVCIRVYYTMKCDAPAGTYYFDLEALLGGPDCEPLCAEPLPVRSATKTVVQQECCLEVGRGPKMPADHSFVCPPTGQAVPNFMQHVSICNPCPFPMPVNGIRLQALGTGNDATGIQSVSFAVDRNCDGIVDFVQPTTPTGTYNADNGTATLCSPSSFMVLQPGECVCLMVFYSMKCPNPVPGTYQFLLTDVLGPNCKPICTYDGNLPIKSAVKEVPPLPCCVEVRPGPKNPPSHTWFPGMKTRNTMFQFEVCNPCPDPVAVNCVQLQAGGTGHDQNDIARVRVYVDLNCDGVRQAGEPLFGQGAYPGDNGTLTIFGSPYVLKQGECACFLVEYIMRPPATPGGTYYMSLTSLCATNAATGADFCIKGLPLKSNIKKRCWWIGEIKHLPALHRICLPRKVVTAVFPDRTYISELYLSADPANSEVGEVPDAHSPGVALTGNWNLKVGDVVDVEGITDLQGCEVVVVPASVDASDYVLWRKTLNMNNQQSGGGPFGNQPGVVDRFLNTWNNIGWSARLNNIGSRVLLWGRVTDVSSPPDAPYFYIDDGSNLMDGTKAADGTPHKGVRVDTTFQQGIMPAVQTGDYVQVEGIMQTIEGDHGLCIRNLAPPAEQGIIAILIGL